MPIYYSGIGSRKTPDHILKLMTKIAKRMAINHIKLRTGGAIGADRAFEDGCNGLKEVYRAEDACEKSLEIASKLHPAWHNCNDYARKLHARNVKIILGEHFNTPSGIVICYTDNGLITGGTGMGIRIAQAYNIQVLNLGNENTLKEVIKSYALEGI